MLRRSEPPWLKMTRRDVSKTKKPSLLKQNNDTNASKYKSIILNEYSCGFCVSKKVVGTKCGKTTKIFAFFFSEFSKLENVGFVTKGKHTI